MPGGRLDLHKLSQARINEEIIATQYNGRFRSDRHSDAKDRLAELINFINGEWDAAYPDGTIAPSKPLIENGIKNAINDVTRLAKEAQASFSFFPRGEKAVDQKNADVQESILETYRHFGRWSRIEKRLYMDLITAGFMAVVGFYNSSSDYPQYRRLDPRYAYPNVQGGELIDMLYTETVSVDALRQMNPDYDIPANADKTAQLVDFYNAKEVVQSIIFTQGGLAKGDNYGVTVIDRWEHGLDKVPVAFRQLESVDGTFRGIFDQASGPIVARNMIVQYLVDYMESMVHSPFEEKGIVNWSAEPGPATIYHHDPTAEESFLRRVPPAAPAGSVFGLLQYLQEAGQDEMVQPPSRSGDVSQSIASGSFVNSTQGQLTSLVKDMQDSMRDLLLDLNEITMRIDEKYCDKRKPLVRSIDGKKTYQPSKDIGGWYYHKVQFGVTAGIGTLNGDARVLQHLGARLIDRGTARDQIDYLPDPLGIEQRVQNEGIMDAILQRFATDPNTPMDALLAVQEMFTSGKSLPEALAAIQDRVKAAAEQQAPSGTPGGAGPEAAPVSPEEEQAALEAGATAEGDSGIKPGEVRLPQAPISQLVSRF